MGDHTTGGHTKTIQKSYSESKDKRLLCLLSEYGLDRFSWWKSLGHLEQGCAPQHTTHLYSRQTCMGKSSTYPLTCDYYNLQVRILWFSSTLAGVTLVADLWLVKGQGSAPSYTDNNMLKLWLSLWRIHCTSWSPVERFSNSLTLIANDPAVTHIPSVGLYNGLGSKDCHQKATYSPKWEVLVWCVRG